MNEIAQLAETEKENLSLDDWSYYIDFATRLCRTITRASWDANAEPEIVVTKPPTSTSRAKARSKVSQVNLSGTAPTRTVRKRKQNRGVGGERTRTDRRPQFVDRNANREEISRGKAVRRAEAEAEKARLATI